MRQTDFRNAFNVGELSPSAWSRSDLVQHSKGCAVGFNMIASVQGPTGRRPGTWFCGLPKFNDKRGRLIPFRRTGQQALLLEFGEYYGRVWTVDGLPLMNGGSQVEFEQPYRDIHMAGLRWRQSGDVIWLTHSGGTQPRILRRNSDTDWVVESLPFRYGPFLAENIDDAHTLSLSGSTLTSSKPLFVADHVNVQFLLRPTDGNPGLLSWEPGETGLTTGAQRLSNGRVYACAGGGTVAGNTPPIHERGTVSDGGVNWAYHDDGAALVKIATVASATSATVNLQSGVPDGLNTGTTLWSEAAYSNLRGWPTANAAIREERLVLAGSSGEPDTVHMTRTAGFSPTGVDFKAGLGTGRVVDDDAVKRLVGGGRDRIVWLADTHHLIAGTTDGEYLISGGTIDDPISPSSCVARPLGEFGSADVMPEIAYGGLMFVASGGQTLRRLAVSPDQTMEQRDLSVVADHIGKRGLVELAWMKQPWNLLWIGLGDGGQASFSYHAEQGVEGWNRHGINALAVPTEDAPLGGGLVQESVCVVPGPNGLPRLFILARRTKGGVTQRMILRMADPTDGLFLDCAEATANNLSLTGVSGLNHLAGETVTLMAATMPGKATPGRGWGEYRDRTVSSGGAAQLPEDVTARRIYAGLPYLSRWEGAPPDIGGPGGTAGRKVRWTHARIVIVAAVAEVGAVGAEGDSGTDRWLNREPGDVAGPVARRKTWRTPLLGGAEEERRLFVQTTSGWDMAIHSIGGDADAG